MEEKYKIINESLNEYCKKIDDTFFIYNLDFFFNIILEVLNIIEKYDLVYSSPSTKKFDILNPDFETKTIYLPGTDSIEIVRGYLANYIPKYLPKFEKFLIDGTFQFFDKDEDESLNETSYSKLNRNGRREINIVLSHTYEDPSVIIHEFFHQLNQTIKEEKKVAWALLTEGISIFFEIDIYDYMNKLGYDEKEINKAKRFRINNCYSLCNKTLTEICLIDSYLKFGSINDTTYEDRVQYNLFGWTTKEDVDYFINKLIKDKKDYKFEYDISIGYIYGTLLAYYGNNCNKDKMRYKFVELNDKVLTENVLDCLKIIDINILDKEVDDIIYDCFTKEVKEINNKYRGNQKIKK